MNHTPAPWQVQDGTLTVYTLTRSVTNAVAVACRAGRDGGSEIALVEAKANATLIAAAPDLLAALTELLEHAECPEADYSAPHEYEFVRDTSIAKARAALKKAGA